MVIPWSPCHRPWLEDHFCTFARFFDRIIYEMKVVKLISFFFAKHQIADQNDINRNERMKED